MCVGNTKRKYEVQNPSKIKGEKDSNRRIYTNVEGQGGIMDWERVV